MSKATATHITPCPVAALAREAKPLIAAAELADELTSTAKPEDENIVRLSQRAVDSLLASVEDRATYLRASEPLGAVFQVHLILTLAILIESHVPESSDYHELCARSLRAIERMAYSVRDFVAESGGADPMDAGAPFYMADTFNPHRLVDDLVQTAATI